MERHFGLGMADLFHPVTGEFNHDSVIDRRGGRNPDQIIGSEKSLGIHDSLAWVDHLYGAGVPGKESEYDVDDPRNPYYRWK